MYLSQTKVNITLYNEIRTKLNYAIENKLPLKTQNNLEKQLAQFQKKTNK